MGIANLLLPFYFGEGGFTDGIYKDLHFGNTEGSDTLEGENILVIGTPYHADFIYKLAAFTMGLDFNEDAEMERQLVTHNGYRFWFTTYKDEKL